MLPTVMQWLLIAVAVTQAVAGLQGDGKRALQRGERATYATFPNVAVELVRGGHLLRVRGLLARIRTSAPSVALVVSAHHVPRVVLLHALLLCLCGFGANPQEGLVQISGTCTGNWDEERGNEFSWAWVLCGDPSLVLNAVLTDFARGASSVNLGRSTSVRCTSISTMFFSCSRSPLEQ